MTDNIVVLLPLGPKAQSMAQSVAKQLLTNDNIVMIAKDAKKLLSLCGNKGCQMAFVLRGSVEDAAMPTQELCKACRLVPMYEMNPLTDGDGEQFSFFSLIADGDVLRRYSVSGGKTAAELIGTQLQRVERFNQNAIKTKAQRSAEREHSQRRVLLWVILAVLIYAFLVITRATLRTSDNQINDDQSEQIHAAMQQYLEEHRNGYDFQAIQFPDVSYADIPSNADLAWVIEHYSELTAGAEDVSGSDVTSDAKAQSK